MTTAQTCGAVCTHGATITSGQFVTIRSLTAIEHSHRGPHLLPSLDCSSLSPAPSAVLFLLRHTESSCPLQLSALLTETLEIWFVWDCGVATFLADILPFRATQHRPEVITYKTVRAANYLLSHYRPLLLLCPEPERLSGRFPRPHCT
jgi:hypothetical protein